MSSQGDDPDTVRAKRLAKLSNSAPSPAPTKPEVSHTPPAPRAHTEAYQQSTSREREPERATPNPPPHQPPANQGPVDTVVMSLEDWEDEAISRIMLVTLDPEKAQHDSEYIFLQGVLRDLADQGQEPRFSIASLEPAILSRTGLDEEQTPFHYLLGAWQRASQMLRELRMDKDRQANDKAKILTEIKRLCVSYAGLSLMMPDMFGNAPREVDLCSYLMQDIFTDIKLPVEFLNELGKRFHEDGLLDVIEPTITNIADEISSMKFNQNYRVAIRAMTYLMNCKQIAAVMPDMPNWIPAPTNPPNGALIEQSLMGRFFALSPLAPGVPQTFFADPKGMSRDKMSMTNNIQEAVRQYQDHLFKICQFIIRSSNEGRRGMLDWFSAALAQNIKRRALQVDWATVASHGFMINIVAVLSKFSEPFVDIFGKKIDKVEVNYFRTIPIGRTTPRVVITEETKLKADQTTADEFLSHKITNVEPHFISEIFFLNCFAHSVGLGPAMSVHHRLDETVNDLQRQIDRINSNPSWRQSPHAALFAAALDRTKKQMDENASLEATMDAVMYDRLSQEKSLDFIGFVANWLLRLVDEKHLHPAQTLKLPLPEDIPIEWRCLPQFLFEIITDHLLYTMRAVPEFMGDRPRPEFIILALTFIGPSGSSYIQNPHLKAKLAEMLYWGTLKHPRFTYGVFGETLNSDTFALEWTFPSLMSFYIEVEHTGLHSQFYDKFNIRYHLSQVMMSVWNNSTHQKRLQQESKNNASRFVQFVNLLLNDVTYLLDEGLSKLIEINKLQKELEQNPSPQDQTAMNQEQREREQTLATTERQATSYISLANETVSLLNKFTAFTPDAFVVPEVVDRLARMLNFNQVVLTGDKCRNLKVKDPARYRFNPKDLLCQLVQIYLNLRTKQAFVIACARDGRSYKAENFQKTIAILSKYAMMQSKDVEAFRRFFNAVEEAKQQDEEGEEALGDIPDEFLDPLMYTLMEEPVILPTSKVSVDLATIKSHLLSDPTDPFNRSPLKIEEVIPDTELKEKIAAFKREKRGKKT